MHDICLILCKTQQQTLQNALISKIIMEGRVKFATELTIFVTKHYVGIYLLLVVEME